jgi:hypothetical protein
MYETRADRPLSRLHFARRMVLHFAVVAGLLIASLALGMTGYMALEDLPWRDAFLNSALLLGGMGPVDNPRTDGGKVFAGLYALYAGLVFLVSIGVVLAPIIHRLMHRYHWKTRD